MIKELIVIAALCAAWFFGICAVAHVLYFISSLF